MCGPTDAPEFEEAEGESDEEYEPQEILNQRIRKGAVQYLVKWQGYSVEESTWELHDNIASSKIVIEAWIAQMKARVEYQ